MFVDLAPHMWYLYLAENGTLRPQIPCTERGRLIAENHPFKVTQKVKSNCSNTHSIW